MGKKSGEHYKLIGKLLEEIKLRRYSFQTGKSYLSVIKNFLSSEKSSRDFLLSQTNKSKSTMRTNYFALKFFHENVLNQNFKENIPLARKSLKLPLVLSRKEVQKMLNVTSNLKHKLVIMFLYYAGIRLE